MRTLLKGFFGGSLTSKLISNRAELHAFSQPVYIVTEIHSVELQCACAPVTHPSLEKNRWFPIPHFLCLFSFLFLLIQSI